MAKRKSYSEKLKDPRWQRKRLEVLQRDGFACILCGDTETELHVHHKVYTAGSEPWDYELTSLITYCKHCHSAVESLKSFSELGPPLKCTKRFLYDKNIYVLMILYDHVEFGPTLSIFSYGGDGVSFIINLRRKTIEEAYAMFNSTQNLINL
jgi:hypothetical protein